jgi:acetamidase/formamidase
MKSHFLTADPTHSRWNRELPPRLEIESGDEVEMAMHDASGGQVQPDFTVAQFVAIDRGRIHSLTGPIEIKGAQPGHVLQIDILAVEHEGWGWTGLIPGMGLLPDRFPKDDFFVWKFEEMFTRSLAPAVVPLRPFCGVMGLAPAEFGEHRTRPPGIFGGNLDIRQLGAGATLYLPVQVPGALFSAGDAHGAQGDGEVCINGIEMPARARFRFTLHRSFTLAEPCAEIPPENPALWSQGSWLFIASRTEPLAAARSVVSQAIDFLVAKTGLSAEHAYILCSVALDLRISQWVNQPTITITGHLPKSLFPTGLARLF